LGFAVDLLILKKSLAPGSDVGSSYRGTERGHPQQLGVVHDLKRAKQLTELLNLFGDSVFYEIVQVGLERGITSGKGGFLGFDVSSGFKPSLLPRVLLAQMGSGVDAAMQELAGLHRSYFLPCLNDHRLFQIYEDAEFCLRTARALNCVRPGWIEGTDLTEYAVTSLYKVL
jgi:hypothetical protein